MGGSMLRAEPEMPGAQIQDTNTGVNLKNKMHRMIEFVLTKDFLMRTSNRSDTVIHDLRTCLMVIIFGAP